MYFFLKSNIKKKFLLPHHRQKLNFEILFIWLFRYFSLIFIENFLFIRPILLQGLIIELRLYK